MRSPDGKEFPNVGCYLELVKHRKLVWTAALEPGYRPMDQATNGAGLPFTAVILLEPKGSGTHYTAIAIHANPEDNKKHEDMCFQEGWGTVVDQMVEHMQSIK